jgi:antitoxin (DNA-binding transcriptional repressor) of toxin-antitoxin stability system
MKTTLINLHDAKTHLSQYARRVRKGERFILCDRNKPFADLRPLLTDDSGRRPFGLAHGSIHVPDNFNEPDPEIEALFSGKV